MYKKIKSHPTTLTLYKNHLKTNKIFAENVFLEIEKTTRETLEKNYNNIHNKKTKLSKFIYPDSLKKVFSYKKALRADIIKTCDTAISRSKLENLVKIITEVPDDFKILTIFDL